MDLRMRRIYCRKALGGGARVRQAKRKREWKKKRQVRREL